MQVFANGKRSFHSLIKFYVIHLKNQRVKNLICQIGSTFIERVNNFKLLGVWFQDDYKLNAHVENITQIFEADIQLMRVQKSATGYMKLHCIIVDYISCTEIN